MIKLFDICNIPINKVLHDDKRAYVKEGHGGKHVTCWPVYRFFQLYYAGEKESAKLAFADWYIDQYTKYSETSKSLGGMKGGSLDRLVKVTKDNSRHEELFSIVLTRVNQRFILFEEILEYGYVPDYENPVRAIKKNHDQYTILSGHHRIAILAVLKQKIVPGVFAFDNNITFLLHRGQQKIVKILSA